MISQKYTTLNDGNVDMDGGNAPARNAHDRQNGIRERRNGYNSRMEDNRNNQAGYNRFNRNNEQDYRYDRDDENDDYRRQSRYDDRVTAITQKVMTTNMMTKTTTPAIMVQPEDPLAITTI